MALIRQSIPALYGGVSQQAPSVRSSIQCEEAINVAFSIDRGASKRPPLECLNEIASVDWSDAFFHYAQFTDNQRYLIVVPGDGTLAVYRVDDASVLSLTGVETPSAYLTAPEGTTASTVFRAYTLGDTTYIVNTTVMVLADVNVTAGSLAGSAQTLQDDALDSAVEGSIYQILGDAVNPVDTYYAKKVTGKWFEWVKPGIQDKLDATTMPHCVVLQSSEVDPMGVIASFTTATWADRLVGDTKSNKFPSFCGSTINGVFFTSDRFGFISGQNVCMSETGEHMNFFRTTVTDVLDSDRIDIKAAADDATELRWMKSIGRSLIVFSEERQFSLDWQGSLSPRSLSITQATAYPTDPVIEPDNAGSNVYFTVPSGSHTHLYEMYVQEQTVTTDAVNVSAHAPSYIPRALRKLVCSPSADSVFLLPSQTNTRLYVYKYAWNGDQRVQSAWSYWDFGDAWILDAEAVGSYLYLIYRMWEPAASAWMTYMGRVLLKVDDAGLADDHFTHPVMLDQLTKVAMQYNIVEDRTYFTTAYPIMSAGLEDSIIVLADPDHRGRILLKDQPTTWTQAASVNSFYVAGDLTTVYGDSTVYVGIPYTKELTLSEQFLDSDKRSVLTTRVQLRSMAIAYQDTGYFSTEVRVRGTPASINDVIPYTELVSSYVSRTVGDAYFQLNTSQLATGVYKFPVLGRTSDTTITVTNDSHLPSHFQSAEWEALVTSRSRR